MNSEARLQGIPQKNRLRPPDADLMGLGLQHMTFSQKMSQLERQPELMLQLDAAFYLAGGNYQQL